MNPDLSKCPICSYPNPRCIPNPTNGTYSFDCPRCRKFIISEEMLNFSDTQVLISNSDKLSGLIRLLAETGGRPIQIFTTNIYQILSDNLIPERTDILKKGELLLNAIKRRTASYGKTVRLQWVTDLSLAFATDYDEFNALIEFLEEKGDINTTTPDTGGTHITITAKGWLNFQNNSKELKQAFIAAWFDENGTMDDTIKTTEEVINECGFYPMCIKKEYYPETILEKAMGEINNSRFIIANLTGSRSSVHFEAGYALGRGIDTIYVCDKAFAKESATFYPKHYKIYFYSDLVELKTILMDVIKARIT